MSDTAKLGLTVSVVVPCKNDARFLTANLDSILSQDYPRLECIVVDGGSSDATVDLLKQYGDRIRWVSEPDRGAFDAINRGWKLSTGDILAWLNADDLWEPGAVRTVVDVFERETDIDVVFGTARVVDELGRVHGDLVPRKWDLERALRDCDHIIFQPASFMRRRILEEVGWLHPAWCHDHDLWLRIARAGGTFARIPARLGVDRLRVDNLGRVAEIVIPGKIGLTKRFFEGPELPPHVRRLRRRAISSAYVRAIDYLQSDHIRHWMWAAGLLTRAVAADPSNVGAIGTRVLRSVRTRGSRVAAGLWSLVRAIGRVLVLVAAFPWKVARRVSGWIVEAVFTRGNRRLDLKVERIRKRMEGRQDKTASALALLRRDQKTKLRALLQAVSGALQPLAERIDRLAADLPQLAHGLEQDHSGIQGALAQLQQHEVRLDAVERAARERAPAKFADASFEVYGTPPTLRRIPGWHTYWGIDPESNPLLRSRIDQWSSLKRPVVMRWLADLLVMIWPGNELSRVLFLTGNFEPNELTWLAHTLTDGMTMIDIGAHMGMYTMMASKLVGDSGVVVAMEPSAREFQRLSFHVTLNDLGNVRCLQEAASDAPGEATLKIAWEWNSGHNTLGEFFNTSVEKTGEERVRLQTVDAVVTAQQLQRVDVIKVDAEGHELKVLTGAVETLARFRPRLLIEVFEETLHAQGASVEALLTFLDRQGYMLKEFSDTTGELVPLRRSPDTASRNVVALPR